MQLRERLRLLQCLLQVQLSLLFLRLLLLRLL
jgi:hypothetical protein